MTKAYRGPGQSIAITGQTTTVRVGSVYRRSGTALANGTRGWIGVITDEIIGSTIPITTIEGRPIDVGDGLSVGNPSQLGDGKGDMFVEGIFTLRLPASGTIVLDADPVYALFTANVASGVVTGAAATNGAVSGSLVGFAEGGAYTATAAPDTGLRVVDVKLLGLPLQAFAAVAP